MISIVLTNFNGSHLLKKNIPKLITLLEKSKLDYELIVVDDKSTDDSRDVLEKFKVQNAKCKIIFKDKNEGFSSTVDLGIRSAKGDFVFTLKTDTLPEKSDYFSKLLSHFESNQNLFAVTACLKTVEDSKIELRGQGQIYFEKGFFLHRRGLQTTGYGLQLSSWPDGSASVFRKEIYLKIGGFDSMFNPFYWEDVDLGYRAWKAGYMVEYEPKAILIHEHEKGSINSHYSKQKQKEISLRNQFLFVWKNADFKHLLNYFWWETYHHAVAIKNGQYFWIRVYWSAFLRCPKILLRRLFLRELNKFSDEQILRILGS